ncbi:MAG TPA: hypothetical protein ENN30_01630 [Candidatus Woesearchaeota archaeon]|nr:hypothetical protein [Candidatus Woesearchaeota archaeon]
MDILREEYIGLGPGKGMKIQLWPNRLVMQRMEKKEGKWEKTQDIVLNIRVLEFIAARMPAWISMMDEKKDKE